MHEMQPIKKHGKTLLQPLQIKFIVHMRILNPTDGVSLSDDFAALCVGLDSIISNELFTEPTVSFASAVKLIECHHKFNLNISNLKMLTDAIRCA